MNRSKDLPTEGMDLLQMDVAGRKWLSFVVTKYGIYMLGKIKRSDALAQYPAFPVSDHEKNEYFFPDVFASYRLTVAAKRGPSLAKGIAENLSLLISLLGYDSLLFLSDLKFPIYRKPSGLRSDINAVAYLQAQQIGPRFNGAIKVPLPELVTCTRHLYWMILTNTLQGVCHFMDAGQHVLGSIHYSGEVLLASLDEPTHQQLLSALPRTAFTTDQVNHPWHYPPPGQVIV